MTADRIAAFSDLISQGRGPAANTALTGATSFLGGEFLFWFLQTGGTAWVLTRDTDSTSLTRRLKQVSFANHVSLPADALENRVRLIHDAEDLRNALPSDFWHFSDAAELEAGQTISYAANAGVQRFVYVSHVPAESAVASQCAELGLAYTILRPSFVVGKDLSNTVDPNGLTELFAALANWQPDTALLSGLENVRINIVPVEQVVYDMLYLQNQELPRQLTVDLCSQSSLSLRDAIESIAGAARDLRYGRDAGLSEDESRRRVESWLQHNAVRLQREEISVGLPAHPSFGLAGLWHCASEWLLWSRLCENAVELRLLPKTEVGQEIAYLIAGPKHAPPLVLINAYSNPAEVLFPLIEQLAKSYRVVTWETDGLRDMRDSAQAPVLDGKAQTAIFQALWRELSLTKALVAGWCSGTQIAISLAATMPEHITAVALLNNGLPVHDLTNSYTAYIQQLQRTCSAIVEAPDMADLFVEMFFGSADDSGLADADAGSPDFAGLPRYLRHLISTPFTTALRLTNYAAVSLSYWDEAQHNRGLLQAIRLPVFVYAGNRDVVAHLRASIDVHESMPDSSLYVDDGANHFEHFLDGPKVSGIVDGFFKSVTMHRSHNTEPATLPDLLLRQAETRPAETAYQFLRNGEDEMAPLTYGGLLSRALAVARMLRRLPPNARVLLVFPSGTEFIQAFFGCFYAGVIPVPVPPPRGRGRGLDLLTSIAGDCGASAILTSATLLSRVRPYLAGFPSLSDLQWFTVEQSASIEPVPRFNHELEPHSIAFLQYTSGSTGDPKGVAVTHANVLDNQRLIQRAFSHGSETVVAGWVPHYHDMGLVGMLMQPLYVGSRCVFMSPEAFLQDPSRWLRLISRVRAYTSMAPPFAYELCVDRVHELPPGTDLSCWRVAIAGAEPIRQRVLNSFAQKFAAWGFHASAFRPCYGLAEATLLATGGVWEANHQANHDTVACGPVRGYQQIEIVSPDRGTVCVPGELGEIWMRGASVASGYWNRPMETDQRFNAFLPDGTGPFLRTQDLGLVSPEGLMIAGRLRNMIILNGQNYFAEDIAGALHHCHPALANGCAALGVNHKEGETLAILQEIRSSNIDDLDAVGVFQAIQKALGNALGIRARSITLLRQGAIPRTTSGKIRYAACYELADNSAGVLVTRTYEPTVEPPSTASDRPMRDRDSIADWLVEQIAQRLHSAPSDIDRFETFAALGLVSVDIIEITEHLATILNVSLDPTMFWEFPSIDLAADELERIAQRSMEDAAQQALAATSVS